MLKAKLTALIAALLLTGCAALPPREAEEQVKSFDEYSTQRSFVAPAGEWPRDAWWTSYGDGQLDALIDEAMQDSPTLAAAEARLRRAQAQAQVSRGAQMPQTSVSASASEQKQSYHYLSPPAFTPQGWNDYGRASLDISWELDFWGKNRAAFAAATSESEAALADAAQARLTLSTSIASAYAEFARLHAAIDTAQAAVAVRTKTADLFRRRHENGLETLGGVRQVEARRASAESDLLLLEEQLGLQRNRIAALMGAGPDRGLTIARPTVDLAQSFALPQNLA